MSLSISLNSQNSYQIKVYGQLDDSWLSCFGGAKVHVETLADEPYLAPDGQLYFFFANASGPDGMIQRAPLQLVRAAPDGVTG